MHRITGIMVLTAFARRLYETPLYIWGSSFQPLFLSLGPSPTKSPTVLAAGVSGATVREAVIEGPESGSIDVINAICHHHEDGDDEDDGGGDEYLRGRAKVCCTRSEASVARQRRLMHAGAHDSR